MVRTPEVGHVAELACCDGYGCCAATAATSFELKHPIEHGIVTNCVSTTPQMTCFRGAKVCSKWLQEEVTIKSYSLTTS